MWVFTFACFVALAVKHRSSSCPVDLSPSKVAVRFGDPLWANCTALTNSTQGMGWESSQGGRPLTIGVTSLDLNISSVTEWGLSSFCFINSGDGHQCTSVLPITVYKTPDKVSISGLISPFVEGQTYEIQCNVFNVAPAKKLLVHWYQGNEIITKATFDELAVRPVNISAVLSLIPHRDHNGSVIWCEAEMDLGKETHLPAIQSEAHRMEVLFPPAFRNATDEELEMREGSPLLLNCTASGSPAPMYSWTFPDPIQLSIENQIANQPLLEPLYPLPGVYTCRVSNSQGNATKAFTVTEAERDRTTFAAIVGGFVAAGVLLIFVGCYFLTHDGTFAFNKGGYQRGQPTSSGPI